MAFYDPLLGGRASDYCVPWERGTLRDSGPSGCDGD